MGSLSSGHGFGISKSSRTLILPAFGTISQSIEVFSKKRIFGFLGMVYAMLCIGFLLRRHNNFFRSKDLTLVHIKGGGLSRRLLSNEGVVEGLVNRA